MMFYLNKQKMFNINAIKIKLNLIKLSKIRY